MGLKLKDFLPLIGFNRHQTPAIRELQNRILELETGNYRATEAGENTNSGQNGTLDAMAQQIRDIEAVAVAARDAATAAAGAAADASSAAAQAQATATFLASQTITVANNALWTDISTNNSWGYDPTYDCQITGVSPASGYIKVTVNGTLTGSNLQKSAILGFEASWPGGGIGFNNYLYYDASVAGPPTTVSRIYAPFYIPPGQPFTVRTRRGASTTNNQQINISAQSLEVLRVY